MLTPDCQRRVETPALPGHTYATYLDVSKLLRSGRRPDTSRCPVRPKLRLRRDGGGGGSGSGGTSLRRTAAGNERASGVRLRVSPAPLRECADGGGVRAEHAPPWITAGLHPPSCDDIGSPPAGAVA